VHSTHSTSDKVYQLLAHGRWFSPASSTTKTGRHDIAEIKQKQSIVRKTFTLKELKFSIFIEKVRLVDP
jgi:hypothetical protein